MSRNLLQQEVEKIFEMRLSGMTYEAIGVEYEMTRQAAFDVIHRKSYQRYVISPDLVQKAKAITAKHGRKEVTSSRMKQIVHCMYEEDGHTQKEIAETLNISQPTVSRILRLN